MGFRQVHVGVGDVVTTGQPVTLVEAMKIEYTLVAPVDGAVSGVHVRAGEQVAKTALLVTIAQASKGQ